MPQHGFGSAELQPHPIVITCVAGLCTQMLWQVPEGVIRGHCGIATHMWHVAGS